MTQQEKAKNKVPVSWTLPPDVVQKVRDVSDGLGISESALVTIQLKIAFGMLDDEAKEYLGRGLPSGIAD